MPSFSNSNKIRYVSSLYNKDSVKTLVRFKSFGPQAAINNPWILAISESKDPCEKVPITHHQAVMSWQIIFKHITLTNTLKLRENMTWF